MGDQPATIGIRREDKSRWERRVPLVPQDLQALGRQNGVQFVVQPSPIRVFSDEAYRQAGARLAEDLSDCPLVMAVKEIPEHLLQAGKTYLFFSHVIKGQPHNMPMLRRLLELGCTLIDYECITEADGRRLVLFGRHAGLAGMIDSLWALGRRLAAEQVLSPLAAIQPAHRYASLAEAKSAVASAGERLRQEGLPPAINPLICGFAGYGNVSNGAQEIMDQLFPREVSPAELPAVREGICKVVFKEQDMVASLEPGAAFDLQDYYQHPEKYRSRFGDYLPFLTLLVNCVYWDARYPRLVTKARLGELFAGTQRPRLRVIGDVSCDIEGAVECTLRPTQPDNPVYVYDPQADRIADGVEGAGPVILAVDNLPCELPAESSVDFSRALRGLIPAIATADYTAPLLDCGLPESVSRGVIVHQGRLTAGYEYLAAKL